MKWTQDLRRIMYKRVLEEFGPHENWDNIRYPKDGERKEFEDFMLEITEGLRKLTGINFKDEGPLLQLAFAVTPQDNIKGGHVGTFILNKAAAYEVGFITTKEMPQQMVMESTNLWKNVG